MAMLARSTYHFDMNFCSKARELISGHKFIGQKILVKSFFLVFPGLRLGKNITVHIRAFIKNTVVLVNESWKKKTFLSVTKNEIQNWSFVRSDLLLWLMEKQKTWEVFCIIIFVKLTFLYPGKHR